MSMLHRTATIPSMCHNFLVPHVQLNVTPLKGKKRQKASMAIIRSMSDDVAIGVLGVSKTFGDKQVRSHPTMLRIFSGPSGDH